MIINADDFGYSSSVNRAILEAFDTGLVSSTTAMANMPGFEEACALAHERSMLAHVGAHLVLSEGEPLTEQIRAVERFCDASGTFARSGGRLFWLPRREQVAVASELRAQIERCRGEGLPLTHLDSHHHVHNEPAIGRIVISLAQEFGVPYVRRARNCGPGIDLSRRLYKLYLNTRIDRAKLARTRYFGVVGDYVYMKERGASPAELDDIDLMIHPVYDVAGVLVDSLEPECSLRELMAKIDGEHSAVSYAGASFG